MRLLAPAEVLMVVVMEWCDLGSLATAIRKQRFRPHGKWAFKSTYVRFCLLDLCRIPCKTFTRSHACSFSDRQALLRVLACISTYASAHMTCNRLYFVC